MVVMSRTGLSALTEYLYHLIVVTVVAVAVVIFIIIITGQFST